MQDLLPRSRPKREKIADPAAHADRYGTGPFRPVREVDLWGGSARHYTTVKHFGLVDGVRWYNNCGPTAVTNLLAMYRERTEPGTDDLRRARALYAGTARFGTRRLYFINSRNRFLRGTSDLRAGSYLRRMFVRAAGVRPAVLLRRATEEDLRRALDRGSLLYLLLHRHPEYGNHHTAVYGYTVLRSETTGEERVYLKMSDGHAAAPRYLDLADLKGRLRFFYEIRFPPEGAPPSA